MAHKIADRVRETTSTTSTGNYALDGAVAGFQAMSASLTVNGDTGFFFVTDGTDWEVFLGTRVDATTLARTTIYASTNSGNAVNWGPGAKDVVGDIPARFCDLLNTIPITVASAATADIGAVNGSQIEISGSVTITSLGTTPNKLRFVRFSGAPLLTHNGTSLILPGAANIQAKAGDTAVFVSDGSGNWRCLNYGPASSGSITPALTFGGGNTGLTYNVQEGFFTRVGNLIFFTATIQLSSKGSSTGAALLTLTGLPVAAAGITNFAMSTYFQNMAFVDSTRHHQSALIAGAANAITFWDNFNVGIIGSTTTQMDDTYFSDSSYVVVTGVYAVA